MSTEAIESIGELPESDVVLAMRTMSEGVQIVDRDYRYVFLNDAAARHGRTSVDLVLGRKMVECYPGIDRTEMWTAIEQAMQGRGPDALVNDFHFPDGEVRKFKLRFVPCQQGVMILSHDVTEEWKTEEQLRHVQKMDALGRLACGVAHDFNNLLSVILTYGSLLADDPRTTSIRKEIGYIKAAGERAATLTKQLLAFSRPKAVPAESADISQAVIDSMKMLERVLEANIEVELRLGEGLPHVPLGSGHFDQILLNLVLNARDAMPRGGTLTISTEVVDLHEDYTNRHLGVVPGRYVLLSVSDTGVGMDHETQARIFEPFFTTKARTHGTGLGLPTVFGLVKAQGGSVWVYSEPGHGATFKVYFKTKDEGVSPTTSIVDTESFRGTETILVVDDHEDVRRAAATVLERFGYTVLEACSVQHCLELADHFDGDIHLLLSDVMMPHLTGPELAIRVKLLRPSIRFIFMSGYAEHALLHRGLIEDGVSYLQKPLLPQQLAMQVRSRLDTAVSPETDRNLVLSAR